MTTLQLKRMSCQPVERQRLTTCLKVFGVWPMPAWSRGFSGHGSSKATYKAGLASKSFQELTVENIYNLYDKAKAAWKELCKKYRPDIGDHEIGVWLNALWSHTEKLFNQAFKRMGVAGI